MLFVLYIIIFNVCYDGCIGDKSAKPKLIRAIILSCKYLIYNCPCFKCFKICFYALEFTLQLQILTVEYAVEFGSCLGWEKRTVLCL
jgi:hypothetical protein